MKSVTTGRGLRGSYGAPLSVKKADPKAKGTVRKPRKSNKKLFSDMTEEEQRLESHKIALRKLKKQQNERWQKTTAKPPSQKQINFLAALIGTDSYSTVMRFVEFANGLPSNTGSVKPFVKGKTWLSRIYFIRAIQMAQTGYNDWFNADDLVAQSMGYEDQWDMQQLEISELLI